MTMIWSRVLLGLLVVMSYPAIDVKADEPALTLNVNGRTFMFSEENFKTFYDHLCSSDTDIIAAYRSYRSPWVARCDTKTLDGEELQRFEYSKRYVCFQTYGRVYFNELSYYNDYYLVCQRIKVSYPPNNDSYCLETDKCWSFCLNTGSTACDLDRVEIIWHKDQSITVNEDNEIINKTPCTGHCNAGITTPPTTASTTTGTTTTTIGEKGMVAQQNDGDDTATIVGVVISLIIIAAILAVLGVLFWRRRKKATAREKTHANHNGNSNTVSRPYSVAFRNDTMDDKPAANTYATIDPSGSSTIGVKSTDDPGYYNQEAIASSRHSESTSNIDSSTNRLFPEHINPDYYNMDNGQSDSTDPNMNAVPSSSTQDTNSDDAGDGYSAVEIDPNVDSTYYYSSGHGSNNNVNGDNHRALINASAATATNGALNGSTEYSYTNPAFSNTGNDHYSKLHDPIRNINHPYDVLASQQVKNNPNAIASSPPPSSASQARFNGYEYASAATPDTGGAYSKLHEPIRNKNHPYNTLAPAESGNAKNQNAPSALPSATGRDASSYSLARPVLNKPKPPAVEVVDIGSAAPGGKRNDYFELESNFNDSDGSESDREDVSDPYSEINDGKDKGEVSV